MAGGALLLARILFLLLAALFRTGGHAFKHQPGSCKFPERWEGTWFQSGVRQPIIIEGARLSSKGTCLGAEGDKFLVVDDKNVCYRCVVIHEKHANVLQYKETYCHGRDSLPVLCGLITGDALLYSMFREDALPVSCPFRGPFTFTYNRGHGECHNPVSSIDVCTEDSRLLLSYQACPDVYGTESTVEELQCLATWKEGSSRYLVGKVHHNHATSNEDRFRCFVYEKTAPTPQQLSAEIGVDYRVAQSGDATCNGLFSAFEGSRTMTLKRAPSLNKCRFPNWLASYVHWHSLDYSVTYSFHHRNSTLRISNTSVLEMKVVCAQVKQATDTSAMLLAHFTMGCQSGYMCMIFYRRDNHVIEVQSGLHSKRSEDACTPAFFNRTAIPYMTLVTPSPDSRQCPYLGKFAVTGLQRTQRHARSSNHNTPGELQQMIRGVHELKRTGGNGAGRRYHTEGRVRVKRLMEHQGNSRCDSEQFTTLVVGCNSYETMEFHSDCPATDFISAYSCHGRWEDNGTNYLITTPLSRSSHGARRYCFIYREMQDMVHFSSSSDNCDRSIRPGVEGGLAFNVTNNGECATYSDGSQRFVSWWTFSVTMVPVVINIVLFQIER